MRCYLELEMVSHEMAQVLGLRTVLELFEQFSKQGLFVLKVELIFFDAMADEIDQSWVRVSLPPP